MNPSEPENNLTKKLAYHDDLDLEFERINLNLREIEFDDL